MRPINAALFMFAETPYTLKTDRINEAIKTIKS